MLNINQSTDSNYRYTMSEIDISHSGKNNLKVTVLNNIQTISTELNHNYDSPIDPFLEDLFYQLMQGNTWEYHFVLTESDIMHH